MIINMKYNNTEKVFDEQWIAYWMNRWKLLIESGEKTTMIFGNYTMETNMRKYGNKLSGNVLFCKFKPYNRYDVDSWSSGFGICVKMFNCFRDNMFQKQLCEAVEIKNDLQNCSINNFRKFLLCMKYTFHKHHQNFVQTCVKTMLINIICEHYTIPDNFTENTQFTNAELVFADEYIVMMITKY